VYVSKSCWIYCTGFLTGKNYPNSSISTPVIPTREIALSGWKPENLVKLVVMLHCGGRRVAKVLLRVSCQKEENKDATVLPL